MRFGQATAVSVLLVACNAARPEEPTTPCPAAIERENAEPVAPEKGATAGPLLIRGATVWTAAGQVLALTDVLVEKGRIAAVGRGLQPPGGGQVIEARGRHLTPGLVDPHSHLGVYPLPHLAGHADGNEVGAPLTPAVRAADALWPQDPGIARALAAGVTTTLVVPGSANLVGGLGTTIHLIPGRSARDLLFPGAPATVKMACGENPVRTYRRKGGPHTRMGSVARMRKLLTRAEEYRRRWRRYREQHAAWCAKGKKRKPLPPEPPKRDAALDTVVQVLEGKAQVHWHCYRADEMLLMLELARDHGFVIRAFHHAVEAYKIRDALARAGTGVVTWVNWWGFKAEMMDTVPESPAMLSRAGVLTALHTDSPVVAQRFVQEAAQAYYHGRSAGLPISEDQAIKLVTLNPARLLGIDDQVGSIAVGKRADLVLWDGHPFSVYTRAERVLIDGQLVYDRSRAPEPRRSDFELGMVPDQVDLPAPRPVGQLPEPAWRSRRRPAEAAGPVLAIVNGRLLPMTDGAEAREGTVLIRGDRIVAAGPGVAVPAGASVVDARGLWVTPGLIAADTTLGLVEISQEARARDHQPEHLRTEVRAALRAWDGLNLSSAAIPIARLQGFTTALIRPYGGLISGQGAAYDLGDGVTGQDVRLVAPVAMHVALGVDSGRPPGGSRALALARLRRLLDEARALKRNRGAVEARRFRRLGAPIPELEALAEVVEGRLPLVVSAHRASDLLAALRLAQEQRLRIVLSGAAEAWRVAPAIAAARVPVLVDVDRALPESFDTMAGRFDNAARLHRAGVTVGFSGDGTAHDARLLRQLAGIAAAWGMPREAALRGLTAVPARVFGLEDRGVLAPGALANVVLWDGDPLELGTTARRVIIDGKEMPPVSRQTRLRDRYR